MHHFGALAQNDKMILIIDVLCLLYLDVVC